MSTAKKVAVKTSCILRLSAVYLLTIFAIAYCIHPYIQQKTVWTDRLTKADQIPYLPKVVNKREVYGRPVRLLIPGSSIDIPVDKGYFDPSSSSWTLSDYRAQFAMPSALANNIGGDTLIYGHNNDFVFGSLRHQTPSQGATALIYTNNGHALEYRFKRAYNLSPTDTSIFSFQGGPSLTIQTCTGSLNEWRTMYQFGFVKVLT